VPLPDADYPRTQTGVTALLVSAWLASAFATSAQVAAAEGEGQPAESEIQRALATVKSDPNLATEGKRRVPSFGEDEARDVLVEPDPSLTAARWLSNLFEWIAETSRALAWVLGALFGTLLALTLVRLLRKPGLRAATAVTTVPTHVRDLDIRPESLPEQIGAAALQLWMQHEHRAALALLYRGLLSRLVHVHGLTVRHSTTEAACIDLANLHLQAHLATYVRQLVRSWQLAVYGGMHPRDEEFRALCTDFDAALPAHVHQATP
jgi:hypothetical protein